MGSALAEGILLSGVPPTRLMVSDRSLAKTKSFWKRKVGTALNAWFPTRWGDIVFLAVRPDAVPETVAGVEAELG